MSLSKFINLPLSWFGVKLSRLSTLRQLQEENDNVTGDILDDKPFMELFAKVQPYTMVGLVRTYALYKSLEKVVEQQTPGDLVECGVWKGGSCMLIAFFLKMKGEDRRRIYLYDTFEGMAEPGPADGAFEKGEWKRLKMNEQNNAWCYSPLDEVKANMEKTGYPAQNIVYVKGKVEETVPGIRPSQIALLRLDTDWYASTAHELKHLFPLLVHRGVLLVDDYGAWQGARKAVDEYFNGSPYHLCRIDHSGRLLIKI